MNLKKQKMYNKTISFFQLMIQPFASDNPLRFRHSLLERIQKLIKTIDEKIRDEKLQYNRES